MQETTSKKHKSAIARFMKRVQVRNPQEPEFLQAIREVADILVPLVEERPAYRQAAILERLAEPERVILFRVPWTDDEGRLRINRGFRVQMNSAIGPYKGGLRFHPSVNLSILKFLAFEQVLKNALTMLPLGGGKGGADFDPKGKSDNEVMRFCQSFMTALFRHVGADTDVLAGDIGVGAREVGFLFGQYKRLRNEFAGVITGKDLSYGGSPIRTEATGYGLGYFVEQMLRFKNSSPAGKKVVVSGAGNVAQYAIEKMLHLGAVPLTASDSDGFIYDPQGIDEDKLAFIKELKNERRGRIREYAEETGCTYREGERPWCIPCDIALPCATQNELNAREARTLVDNGCRLVAEGANMPCTQEAIAVFQKANVFFGPGKAANAGGVATSGLEMVQNATHVQWNDQKVDERLRENMRHIHDQCLRFGEQEDGNINYVRGANIAGFLRIADAMLAQGHV